MNFWLKQVTIRNRQPLPYSTRLPNTDSGESDTSCPSYVCNNSSSSTFISASLTINHESKPSESVLETNRGPQGSHVEALITINWSHTNETEYGLQYRTGNMFGSGIHDENKVLDSFNSSRRNITTCSSEPAFFYLSGHSFKDRSRPLAISQDVGIQGTFYLKWSNIDPELTCARNSHSLRFPSSSSPIFPS